MTTFPPPISQVEMPPLFLSQMLCSAKRMGVMFFIICLLTALGDQMFFNREPGISITIFTMGILGLVTIIHPQILRCPGTMFIAILLLASSIQSGMETGFSNSVCLITCILALLGHLHFASLTDPLHRWIEGLITVFKPFGRWFQLVQLATIRMLSRIPYFRHTPDRILFCIRIGFPTIALLIIFTWSLSMGSRLFQHFLSEEWTMVAKSLEWLWKIPFPTPGRVLFWMITSSFILLWILPTRIPKQRFWWRDRPLGSVQESAYTLERMKRLSILMTLNGLFLVFNLIDVIYLWFQFELPSDVTYSSLLHDGVHHLIFSVLLSSLVLIRIHRHRLPPELEKGVMRWTGIWMIQNGILILGVFNRLWRYVDEYEMSVLRVGVVLFLMLVMIGFGFLWFKIRYHQNLGWLITRNIQATFTLLFVLQFINLQGWVADFNVNRWLIESKRKLDLCYIQCLGHPAWSSLWKVALSEDFPDKAREARQILQGELNAEQREATNRDWPSWQWNRSRRFQYFEQRMEGLP